LFFFSISIFFSFSRFFSDIKLENMFIYWEWAQFFFIKEYIKIKNTFL
jgi:hypothetical protein